MEQPLLPDYGGACVSSVVPTLLEPPVDRPAWLPVEATGAEQVVLLVLDGLGWCQFEQRRALTPTLSAMSGGPITTVAPSTTATALTSIATGLTPGEHGVVGYRLDVEGDILNILRWAVEGRDAREQIRPESIQFAEPFLGHRPAIVTRTDFKGTGFTVAHLEGTRFSGYRMTSTMVATVARLLRENEPFVYAYYEGVDKVAHEYGLGEMYDAEVAAADRLVADLISVLPDGAALVVTADHGQLHVGNRILPLHPDVLAHTSRQSGEGRFRWLHARPGRAEALLDAATRHHGDVAWVTTREQTIADGWFGPKVTEAARNRLGDVALVAREPIAFHDPTDTGPYELIGRHGSLTEDEMLVPLLVARP